jgi:predicted nucleic acid-binding protein
MKSIFILDACAVISLLNEETEVNAMNELIVQARNGELSLYINAINRFEIRYGYLRDETSEEFNRIWIEYEKLPINCIRSINDNIITESARLKVTYKIPVCDAIGLATAFVYGGKFVTKDATDFQKIDEAEPGIIHWLR